MPSGAQVTSEQVAEFDSYRLPVAPWSDQYLPVERVEGTVSRQAFRIEGGGITTAQLMSPLRDQIVAEGFAIHLDCAARDCGGFDFRFAIEVLAAPAMYVDMTDYRFLSASSPDGGTHLSVLISNTASASFVQIIRVGAGARQPTITASAPMPRTAPGPTGDIPVALESAGHVILSDLTFDPGSSSLGVGPFATLKALADYLKANPNREIMFVGHTDATGSLETNIALSRQRAQSVVDYITEQLGVSRNQVSAQGMGYLSPVASSLTEEGREANRRVEAVLISTE